MMLENKSHVVITLVADKLS